MASNQTNCTINFLDSEINISMLLTLVENLIALTVFATLKTKRSNTHLMIKVMAVSDFFAALCITISSVVLTATCDSFADSIVCEIIGWLALSSFCWSLHVICVMNVERYYMICHPLFHHVHFSRKLMIELCAGGFIVVFLLVGLPLVGIGAPYNFYDGNRICAFDLAPSRHPQQRILIAVASCLGLVWVAITVFCNIAIVYKLYRNKQLGENERRRPSRMDASQVKKRCNCLPCLKNNAESQYGLVATVLAVVNCVMNLPFYVSMHFFHM